MLVHSSSWLCEVAGYWQELNNAVVYADPEHSKHAQWVTCPVSMLAMQELGFFSASRNCVQILATWGRALSMLQHEVIVVIEWHNNGPKGSSSRYHCGIQNAINKCHLCFIGHNIRLAHTITPPPPGPLRSQTLTSVNRSPTCNHTRCLHIMPCTVKPGFIREETPLNMSIAHFKSVTTTNCSQVETLMRTTGMQMSFSETVSDSLCRNSLVMQTDCCNSCPWGWSQTILEVKMLDVDVLG